MRKINRREARAERFFLEMSTIDEGDATPNPFPAGLSSMADSSAEDDDNYDELDLRERMRYGNITEPDSSDEENDGGGNQDDDDEEEDNGGQYEYRGMNEDDLEDGEEGPDNNENEEEFPYEEVFGEFESYEEIANLSKAEPLDFLERDYLATLQATRTTTLAVDGGGGNTTASEDISVSSHVAASMEELRLDGGLRREQQNKQPPLPTPPPPPSLPPSIPPLTQERISSIKNIMKGIQLKQPSLGVAALLESIERNPPRVGDEVTM